MNRIVLENFRCFRAEQEARLAPLTVLVGENSTGKTSFLALIRALWDTAYGLYPADFKEAPYDLGSFDEIAHFRGGRGGRASEFSAAFDAEPRSVRRRRRHSDTPAPSVGLHVTFGQNGTAPVPARWRFEYGDTSLDVTESELEVRHRGLSLWQRPIPGELQNVGAIPSMIVGAECRRLLLRREGNRPPPSGLTVDLGPEEREGLERLDREFGISRLRGRLFASSPVRSRPRRTYDPARPDQDPEGENTPMFLSSLFMEDKAAWSRMKKALESFGREAELFDEISVRMLGKKGSEPFQVQVRKLGKKAKGPKRNLIDVGYGVSQVLPLVTELFRSPQPPMFLLQQPEVHLHPRAQAALGSLFCRQASWRRQIVVETHSDHLLDRVRMDVRDGKSRLKPEDVSVLYFERENLGVRIHSIRLDGQGNVLDAPPSYRQFFMDETRRSLKL